jgi:type III restriction enzyme
MTDHALKEYQRDCLTILAAFCDEVRAGIGRDVPHPVHDAFRTVAGREFLAVPQLPDVPYVCLRVPTGGGKTLIAAHAVGAVAKRLGRQDRPLCLWVTPSTTIRDQTLRGLRDRDHPYRQALQESLGTAPEVLTLEEALSLGRTLLGSAPVVIVTTIQSYRIRNDRGEEEQAARKIYEDNGYLMDHFTALPDWLRGQLREPESGRVALSLANVLKLRGPLVVMDEAHNARTKTSFDSLARMGPLAVLELTATPEQKSDPAEGRYASNVLHAVSALQLQREGMIKLPVVLESRADWLDVLDATVQRRAVLAARAAAWHREGGRFIRPVALIQAQPRRKDRETHTAEKVKEALVGKLNVPAERVRIATGDTDELGDEDLSRSDCVVDYVVTVERLREGWDCPFAYVLGSVGNVATPTAVEQLLGRVLRMPHATPTGIPELDRAYAFVESDEVSSVAAKLADGLVKTSGFDQNTAADALRVHRQQAASLLPFSFIPVSAPPDLTALAPAVQAKIVYEPESKRINVRLPLTADDANALQSVLPAPADKVAVETFWKEERPAGAPAKALGAYAIPLQVPQLAVRDGQLLLPFDPVELEEFDWDLNTCDPAFTTAEFPEELQVGDRVEVFLTERGAVRVGGVAEVLVRQQSLLPFDDDWQKADLVRWLDRELHRGGRNAGLSGSESHAWLSRVLDALIAGRGVPLTALVRRRHELADLIDHRVVDHGRRQVRKAAASLFADAGRRLVTTPELPFVLSEQAYTAYRLYSGPFAFVRHAFDRIGEMGAEEGECARKLDDHANVERWLRNLSYESAGGFSLPLSPGRFFPDFLAELRDGRTVAVEYKGRHRADLAEERHKKAVGELWEARSDRKCVFAWVVDKDWATLEIKLGS